MLRVRVTLRPALRRTENRPARQRNPHRVDFNSLHIIPWRRYLPSHSTAAGPVVAGQAADTAAVEVPEAAQVAAREAELAAARGVEPEAARVGLEAALAERAVAREAGGLAVRATLTAILLTIRRGRLFRSFLRPHPPINK